jgi:hypothetical protein
MAANVNSNTAMEKLIAILNRLNLLKVSRETGFVKRNPLKAQGDKFLLGFLNAVFCNQVSLMCLAFSIGQFINDTLSKVAVRKRLNAGLATFLNRILAVVLSDQLQAQKPLLESQALKSFNAVHLQDSTSISLVARLATFFPGSGTSTGKKVATLKIQLIYDAIAECFTFFDIGSFRDNDQKASSLILKVAKAGDLVIRDLGYFVLDVFAQLQQKAIFFLSRLPYNVNIYSPDGASQIDLVKRLKKHLRNSANAAVPLDLDVRIGAKSLLPVRLVIIPLPDGVANEKRRKAKNNRDRRANPDKDHLFLLGFNIFITNVERPACRLHSTSQTWTVKQVAEVYQLRWRIEIIFKTWKSHFHITNVPTSSAACVEAYIYAMLIFITLIHICIFIPLFQTLYQQQEKYLSLLKVTKLLNLILSSRLKPYMTIDNPENLIRQILYHGAYEKRERLSYPQILMR